VQAVRTRGDAVERERRADIDTDGDTNVIAFLRTGPS
jgi:hypothetical protein